MPYIKYVAFLQSLAAVLGSLFMSQVLNFPPCILCWYQRIFLYPIFFIITAGILRNDKKFYLYVLPLSVIGLIISFYHNLLYYSILPENVAPCVQGIFCTTKQLQFLGFITIPLLSFTAFSIITLCMLILKRSDRKI